MEFFANFLHERFLEIWLGQGKRYRQTDGRTDIHGGKNNICLPQGETYNNKPVMWDVHLLVLERLFTDCG